MSQLLVGLYRVIRNENNPVRYAQVDTKNGETSVLNLTVVPFRTREGDNIGTEWIKVAIWGNAADWYQNIPHNTVVFIQGTKDIKNWESGDKTGTSPEVTIRMGDVFQPFTGLWRDDNQSTSDSKEEPLEVKSRSVVKTAPDDSEIPF